MNKHTIVKKRLWLSSVVASIALAGIMVFAAACGKHNGDIKPAVAASQHSITELAAGGNDKGRHVFTSTVTIAMLRGAADGKMLRAMFNENPQILTVTDAAAITALKEAYSQNRAVQITFDPHAAMVLNVTQPTVQEQLTLHAMQLNNAQGLTKKVDLGTMPASLFDEPAAMGVINTTDTSLTSVIPDMQTAQMMFDYMAHQCCQLPGPYGIDYCLTFQYCPDGCYARAHKMCWILNNRYKYATQKIFSFANAGSDVLSVRADKWGGCCINWWYHVAPLVTVNTPKGPKAYVFDPAMFDQPVLLSAWLHAQENPNCVSSGDVPHVTMINIQPTASYWPASGSGYLFGTDPTYSSTNSTLVSYQYLISCP